MNTNLQANGHTSGQEEILEKIHTSQGLVLTGSKAEEFRKMALDVVEGNNEVIKMLDDLEEEKERKRLKKEQEEKPTLEEIYKLLRYSGNDWLIKSADLIEKSGNIDEKDSDGDTALHNSSRLGFTNIVDKLLKAGSDIEARGNNGKTPLIFASIYGKAETVKFLLDKGAKVNEKLYNGLTALKLTDNQEIIDLLKSYGATL